VSPRRALAALALASIAGCTSFRAPFPASIYRTTATGSPIASTRIHGSKGPSGDNELLRAGLITLGASWVATVAIGQFSKNVLFDQFARDVHGETTVDKLWLPVYGAWDGLIYNETDVRTACDMRVATSGGSCTLTTVSSIAISVGALAQTTGLVLAIVGVATAGGGKRSAGKMALVPRATADGAGVTLVGGF
jgi:hypothetical protein